MRKSICKMIVAFFLVFVVTLSGCIAAPLYYGGAYLVGAYIVAGIVTYWALINAPKFIASLKSYKDKQSNQSGVSGVSIEQPGDLKVVKAQILLNQLDKNLYLQEDGILGPATTAAIVKWQIKKRNEGDEKMETDGEVDSFLSHFPNVKKYN